jgi:hypothetical protein
MLDIIPDILGKYNKDLFDDETAAYYDKEEKTIIEVMAPMINKWKPDIENKLRGIYYKIPYTDNKGNPLGLLITNELIETCPWGGDCNAI